MTKYDKNCKVFRRLLSYCMEHFYTLLYTEFLPFVSVPNLLHNLLQVMRRGAYRCIIRGWVSN